MYTGDLKCSGVSMTPGGPIRLNAIKGYPPRTNNVIYCPPLVKSPKDQVPGAVVYFGGDVQVKLYLLFLFFEASDQYS